MRIPVILCLVLAAFPAAAQNMQQRGDRMAEAIVAMKADNWQSASRIVAATGEPAAVIYADWRRLRAGDGHWPEYRDFIKTHADWPGLPFLSKKGEASIPANARADEVVAYFDAHAPQTGTGALRLAAALQSLGRTAEAEGAIVAAWTGLALTQLERETIQGRYGRLAGPLNWTRTDTMIWDGEMGQAEAMLPFLDAGQAALARARIELRRNKDGVNALINKVPASLAKDPGLAHDRFVWRHRRDLDNSAIELILSRSTSREALGRPEAWADRRARLARQAMRDGRVDTAYRLASTHRLRSSEDGFTDLEWLAGYIALRKRNDPTAAIAHFRALRPVAVTPITSGRVWYWLGRAHEADGNAAKAAEAYGVATRYQTSFYGQLATERGGLAPDARLTGAPTVPWKGAAFTTSSVYRAGELLHYAGERYEGGRFFAHMAETMSEAEQAALGQRLLELGEPNMALRVAKNAANLGRIIAAPYYPLAPLASEVGRVRPEEALAIMRQESEFNPSVVSSAGARGLMQLMPGTAKDVAGRIGLPYSRARLLSDETYNATLGSQYLAEMLERYSGSIVLAAAAYNAGPHRADRWIEAYGDPRNPRVDVEDWIEGIPFSETRNYVMRVTEALHVYRARLSGQVQPVRISKDMRSVR